MKRNILAQGDRDGACFLYSIANAVGALTKGAITQAQWKNWIQSSPFCMNDFIKGDGTKKIDSKHHHLGGLCSDLFDTLMKSSKKMNGCFEVEWINGLNSIKKLGAVLSPSKVLIMGINNDEHWVTIVDVDGKDVFISCSAEALNGVSEYFEKKSPKLNRFYNKKTTFHDLEAGEGYGLLISLSPKLEV